MPAAFADIDHREARAALRRAAQLNARLEADRVERDELILLANRGGCTYDEISQALGCSRTTVTNAINRAAAA